MRGADRLVARPSLHSKSTTTTTTTRRRRMRMTIQEWNSCYGTGRYDRPRLPCCSCHGRRCLRMRLLGVGYGTLGSPSISDWSTNRPSWSHLVSTPQHAARLPSCGTLEQHEVVCFCCYCCCCRGGWHCLGGDWCCCGCRHRCGGCCFVTCLSRIHRHALTTDGWYLLVDCERSDLDLAVLQR